MSTLDVPSSGDAEYVPEKQDLIKKKGYQHVISQISEEFGSFQEKVYFNDLEYAYRILERHPEIAEIEIVSTPSVFRFRLVETGFLRRSHELEIERSVGSRTIRFVR